MDVRPIIVFVRSEMAPAIRKRLAGNPDVLVVPASDSLGALEVMRRHRPRIVALDASFAATARGALLVAEIKSDPLLQAVDLRSLTEDEDHFPVALDRDVTPTTAAISAVTRPLDHCGTRAMVRTRMSDVVEVMVNGKRCDMIDLSVTGAQVAAPTRLRPDESVRLAFSDGSAHTRCHALVAWVKVEPPNGIIKYRVGLRFLDPEPTILRGFCEKYGMDPISVT